MKQLLTFLLVLILSASLSLALDEGALNGLTGAELSGPAGIIFENTELNLYLVGENGAETAYGVITKDKKIHALVPGGVENPSFKLYVDAATFAELISSSNPLPAIKKALLNHKIKAQVDYLPGMVGKLFGNERINAYLIKSTGDVTVFGLITQDKKIQELGLNEISDPSINIYLDQATLAEIKDSVNPLVRLNQALDEKSIKYEGVGLADKVKLGFLSSLTSFAGLFGSDLDGSKELAEEKLKTQQLEMQLSDLSPEELETARVAAEKNEKGAVAGLAIAGKKLPRVAKEQLQRAISKAQVRAHCGDNLLRANEQCDDGNKIVGDGCSDLCLIEKPDLSIISAAYSLLNTDPGSSGAYVNVSAVVKNVGTEDSGEFHTLFNYSTFNYLGLSDLPYTANFGLPKNAEESVSTTYLCGKSHSIKLRADYSVIPVYKNKIDELNEANNEYILFVNC